MTTRSTSYYDRVTSVSHTLPQLRLIGQVCPSPNETKSTCGCAQARSGGATTTRSHKHGCQDQVVEMRMRMSSWVPTWSSYITPSLEWSVLVLQIRVCSARYPTLRYLSKGNFLVSSAVSHVTPITCATLCTLSNNSVSRPNCSMLCE